MRYQFASSVAALFAPLVTFAQTANMPTSADLSVGDTWSWQQSDDRTKVKEQTTSLTVVSNRGEKMLSTGTQLRRLSDYYVDGLYQLPGTNQMPVAQPWRVWPLDVGKKWTFDMDWVRQDGVTGNTHQDVEVAAFEEVEVPAGKFMAFRIVHKGFYRNSTGARGRETDIYWYAPEVKANIKTRVDDGLYLITRELVSYSKGSAALASVSTPPATGNATRTYLDKDKLTAMFVGKGARMRRDSDGATAKFSFNNDGSAIREREAGKNRVTAGTWEFGSDQICAHFGADNPCFKFFDDSGVLKASVGEGDVHWQVLQIQ